MMPMQLITMSGFTSENRVSIFLSESTLILEIKFFLRFFLNKSFDVADLTEPYTK